MKKSNLKILILVFVCLIAFTLSNFNSIISAQEMKIDFEKYSVIVPGGGWKITAKDEAHQIVGLSKKATNKENSQIMINYVPVLEPTLWGLSKEDLAKNFIANEKLIMVLEGEKKGLYKLANVVEGVDNINGRKFYTMSYQNLVKDYIVDGLLYVYIPPAEKHKELFAVVFTNGHRKNQPPASNLEEFIEVLKSLDIR